MVLATHEVVDNLVLWDVTMIRIILWTLLPKIRKSPFH